MEAIETDLAGVLLIKPQVFGDSRGQLFESYHAARYADSGIPSGFVQDNVSRSGRDVLRGLHFQHPHVQAKLVQVLDGEIYDVAVDIRVGSPQFGQWVGVRINSDEPRQLFIPEGFAHGFVVLSKTALFSYKCSEFYDPACERSVLWNDPDIGIDWPVSSPILSAKDAGASPLGGFGPKDLPGYAAGG
jgi:dTDP-4-dehydrorhamnose 3,5-epimerase